MSRTRTALLVAVAALLLAIFIDRFLLVRLLWARAGAPAMLAILEMLAVTGAGFLARRLRAGDPVLDFAIGYPLFGALCFLVGSVRISAGAMLPLVLAFAAAGTFSIVRGRTVKIAPLHPAFVIVFACALVWAQAPPVSLDELAYHLAVPHTWLLEGRAIELPLLSHSYFPLGIESADLPLLSFLGPLGGGIASHLLHLIAAVAATTLLFRLTRDNALATAAIVTTPALAIMAGWSMSDIPLIAICAALTLALAEMDGVTVAAAIAAGLLTKYTFIPFAVVALLVALPQWRRITPEGRSPRRTLYRSVAGGIAAGSLFFIRNMLLTGNPFAPFFGALAPHVSGYRGPALLSSYVFDGSFLDEALGISIFIPSLLATGILAWALVGVGVALSFLAPSARLLLPFFSVSSAIGGRHLTNRVLKFFVMTGIVLQSFLVAHYTMVSEPWTLLTGRVSDEQFVATRRSSYRAVNWLNQALPAGSLTLVIGLQETYWFERRVRGGGNFDSQRLSRYLEAPTAEALRARLRGDGFTHVAIVATGTRTEVATKVEERRTELSAGASQTLAAMLARYGRSHRGTGEAELFVLR